MPAPLTIATSRPLLNQDAADAVAFDGVDQRLTLASGLGMVDGKVGALSCWFKINGGDATNLRIFSSEGDRLALVRATDDRFTLEGRNAANTKILELRSNNQYVAGQGWGNILFSWDLANALGDVWGNGAEDKKAGETLTDEAIDYTRTNWRIGSTGSGASQYLNGCLYSIWLDTTAYIDFSDAAERAKFINGLPGSPVNLGKNGELPTGTSPALFVQGGVPGFFTNRGAGGGVFSAEGTRQFVDCIDNP